MRAVRRLRSSTRGLCRGCFTGSGARQAFNSLSVPKTFPGVQTTKVQSDSEERLNETLKRSECAVAAVYVEVLQAAEISFCRMQCGCQIVLLRRNSKVLTYLEKSSALAYVEMVSYFLKDFRS